MCDAENLLKQMKSHQVKPDPLVCTFSTSCWCSNVEFKAPIDPTLGECFSPSEMLEKWGDVMDEEDRRYLSSLVNREFFN